MAIRIQKDEGNFGPGFLGCWVSTFDDDGGCNVWAIFDRKIVDPFLGLDNIAEELTGWEEFHSGPGRPYGERPKFKVYRHKVLVYQHRGLDI